MGLAGKSTAPHAADEQSSETLRPAMLIVLYSLSLCRGWKLCPPPWPYLLSLLLTVYLTMEPLLLSILLPQLPDWLGLTGLCHEAQLGPPSLPLLPLSLPSPSLPHTYLLSLSPFVSSLLPSLSSFLGLKKPNWSQAYYVAEDDLELLIPLLLSVLGLHICQAQLSAPLSLQNYASNMEGSAKKPWNSLNSAHTDWPGTTSLDLRDPGPASRCGGFSSTATLNGVRKLI